METKLQENSNILNVNKDLTLYQEYERMYVSTGDTFPSVYFLDLSSEQKQEQALKIIRFALEKYLKWTPNNIRYYLSSSVLEKMKLQKIVNKYIKFPLEYSKNDLDMTYLAYLLYPNKFHLNIEDQCITMFEKVNNGSMSKFPPEWIRGIEGIRRFSILLQYMISQMPRFKNQEEMYEFFAGPKAVTTFKKYKIYYIAIALYPNVFEAFHQSLPRHLKSEFLYHYCLFHKKTGL